MLTHLSLFTGIAGFELAFKLANLDIQTVGYCEIDEYCQDVIKARIRDGYLDDAPIFPDIRTFPCDEYQGLVDIITGGFPCQDISAAGRGAGIHGERSGLWWEMRRCISEIRPSYVFLENVPAILVRGLDEVIGSLAELGYDCEWGIVSAADVGAPHLRKRWWCMAADASNGKLYKQHRWRYGESGPSEIQPTRDGKNRAMAYSQGQGLEERRRESEEPRLVDGSTHMVDAECIDRYWQSNAGQKAQSQRWAETTTCQSSWWTVEPDVGRVADELSDRLDGIE